jgi:hypothetical protein
MPLFDMPNLKTLAVFLFGRKDPLSTGSDEFFWRALWIVFSILAVSYASYLYFGSVHAAYFGEAPPIRILRVLKNGDEHHLSGNLPVPTTCHGLTVVPRAVSDTHFELAFTTWQEPARTCEPLGESRSFSTVIFSKTADISFSAILNGKELPIRIVKQY